MKVSNKRKLIISVFTVVILAVFVIFLVHKLNVNNKKITNEETKIEQEIKKYGYVLLKNETALYREYFNELIAELNKQEIDEKLYASSVVKLFIADFYDLNSKKTKNDVGGIQFIYEPVRDNFILNAKDTIYKYIENNLNDDRIQNLPSVTEVTIDSVEITSYTYNNSSLTDDTAYKIKVTWKYNKDLGYQTTATFTLMHDNKKLVIVEIE